MISCMNVAWYFTFLSNFICVCESYSPYIFPSVLVIDVLDPVEKKHVAEDDVFPSTVHVANAKDVNPEWLRDLSYVVVSASVFWIIIALRMIMLNQIW